MHIIRRFGTVEMSGNEEEEDVINEVRQQEVIKELKEKKVSSQKLRVYESDMEESDDISDHHNGHNSKVFPVGIYI